MKLEVIAACIEDALIAEQCGADRLELLTAITEGGLTPGIGLVKQAVKAVRIPVFVMVRPHSRSFVYSSHDVATMAEEIKSIHAAGAEGIVLGALTPEGHIDERTLEALLPLAGSMEVTFHRAFDELEDQITGLHTLSYYPAITRVLTSGGSKPAPESVSAIQRLVAEAAGGSIRILAGSGLTPEGIEAFITQTGVEEVHFGSAVRKDRSGLNPIQADVLSRLADTVHALKPHM